MDITDLLFKIFIYMILPVIATIAYTYWVKKSRYGSQNESHIKIISSKYLAYKTQVMLIEVEDTKFILIQTPSNIVLKKVGSSTSITNTGLDTHIKLTST